MTVRTDPARDHVAPGRTLQDVANPPKTPGAPRPVGAYASSTLMTALVMLMLAEPGGLVTRGLLPLRPADIEIETEIVVLRTSWAARSTVVDRFGVVKLNGVVTPFAVNPPVPLARQYVDRSRSRLPAWT